MAAGWHQMTYCSLVLPDQRQANSDGILAINRQEPYFSVEWVAGKHPIRCELFCNNIALVLSEFSPFLNGEGKSIFILSWSDFPWQKRSGKQDIIIII